MGRCTFHDISFLPQCDACVKLVAADCNDPACLQLRQSLADRLEAIHSISCQRAGRYLAQVNLSIYGPTEGVQACESSLDVLERFLSDELDEHVTIHPISTAPEFDHGVAVRHAMIGRIMVGTLGKERPFVVEGVRTGVAAGEEAVLVRVAVCWA